MSKLIIFGNSLFAEIAVYYFKNFSDYKICYIACDKGYLKNKYFQNIENITYEQLLKKDKSEFCIYIAIGYSKMNKLRETVYNRIKKKGFKIANFIHPNAKVYSKKIGENNFVMENVSLNPYSKIGNNNVFWSGSIIGHHSKIGNNNFFSGNSTISGNCNLKNNIFFGVNSCIKDSTIVKDYCFIDANQYVSKNLEKETYYNEKINPNLSLKTSRIFF